MRSFARPPVRKFSSPTLPVQCPNTLPYDFERPISTGLFPTFFKYLHNSHSCFPQSLLLQKPGSITLSQHFSTTCLDNASVLFLIRRASSTGRRRLQNPFRIFLSSPTTFRFGPVLLKLHSFHIGGNHKKWQWDTSSDRDVHALPNPPVWTQPPAFHI